MTKYVYRFDEGSKDMKGLLGGKGANLAEMTNLGLPVPPGFTISTEACIAYLKDKAMPAGLSEQVATALAGLEQQAGKRFGGSHTPLLVSVRSGAAFSMPGMMDTILNLGLTDETVLAHAQATGNPRFAWDCYRRFIQMYSDVVMGLPIHNFERALERQRQKAGVATDPELSAADLQALVAEYRAIVRKLAGRDFPQDPQEQLSMAIKAVFDSWNTDRAVYYRTREKIPHDMGTAVNVQMMAFGNMGDDSGTGVVFTRNPSTGAKEFYGEYLLNAQGEDVVAGIRTPQPIVTLQREMSGAYDQLFAVCEKLEQHYGDMQDIEFTIERGKLYMLQCRTGKRTAQAAIRIAADMVHEGKLTREQALLRVKPEQVEQMLHRGIDQAARLDVLAEGLPASPGAAVGMAVFDADRAEALAHEGRDVILIRPETTPDDIHGIVPARGVLTSRGGMTCHAAIVARGMGKPCVVGCESITIDLDARQFTRNGRVIREGDVISIDGGTGKVIAGAVPLVNPGISPAFAEFLEWADAVRTLGVWANADTPEDAARSREFGAGGIGLARTEHMFMAQDRLPAMQEMIIADSLEERQTALNKLLPMQQSDFYGILLAMDGLPVIIRLLDPPLHEFLPKEEKLSDEIAALQGTQAAGTLDAAGARELADKEKQLRRARQLHEANPMLGFRGTRLGLIYPEIYEMQVRAIFLAASALVKAGRNPMPEVMIPLISHPNEMHLMRELVVRTAEDVMAEQKVSFHYQVGACIEVPRACLLAEEIAREAEFFSYGTNDLTQTTFGFSRDDAQAKFLALYVQNKVLLKDPFITLDPDGVGRLVEMGAQLGRRTRPDLKVGICGEHGGDPESIAFCHQAGLNYVSCSPFRVPVARLAAAQAALHQTEKARV